MAEAPREEQFDPQVCVVLGTQWGDEGKGKLVDILAQQYEIVARAQVGDDVKYCVVLCFVWFPVGLAAVAATQCWF